MVPERRRDKCVDGFGKCLKIPFFNHYGILGDKSSIQDFGSGGKDNDGNLWGYRPNRLQNLDFIQSSSTVEVRAANHQVNVRMVKRLHKGLRAVFSGQVPVSARLHDPAYLEACLKIRIKM